MSVIQDILPKFYLNDVSESLTEEELVLIAPKQVQDKYTLLFDDIIIESEEPAQGHETTRHGFTKPVQIAHAQMLYSKSAFYKNTSINNYEKANVQYIFETMAQKITHINLQIKKNEEISTSQTVNNLAVKQPMHPHKVLPPVLLKHHYQIAAHLLKAGYVDTHQAIKNHAKSIYTMIYSDLSDMISAYVKNSNNATLHKIESLLDTILLFANHGASPCYVPDLTQTHTEVTTYVPLGLMLKVYASLSPDHQLKSKLLASADYLSTIDPSETQFLYAKNLLLQFPTGKHYELQVGDKDHVYINSENGYSLFSTRLAHDSLNLYLTELKAKNADSQQIEVFEDLVSIFGQAACTCEHRTMPQTSEWLSSQYENGDTVLVPTGWQGHSFDIALNKSQALHLTANSGELSEQSLSGDTFRHLDNPHLIDDVFFNELLTNTHFDFEKSLQAQYAISEPIDFIPKPEQRFGNCVWESHRDAVEGLAYMKLLSKLDDAMVAKTLANTYFKGWDSFHGNYVIDTYLKNNPSLPTSALADILDELQAENNPVHEEAIEKISGILGVACEATHPEAILAQTPDEIAHFTPFIAPLEPIIASPEPILVC